MAEPKKISTRIINKHATAAVWNDTNFTPLQGEIVVYDPGYDSTDEKTYSYERMKIGDGSHTIQELPFITETLNLELTAEDNNSLLMWDNNNSTFVSSPLAKGTGDNSLIIGEGVASGTSSHAGGYDTIASGFAQTAIGKYNKENDNALFIIGNGTSKGDRRNAFEVLSNGSIKVGSTTLTEAQLIKILNFIDTIEG